MENIYEFFLEDLNIGFAILLLVINIFLNHYVVTKQELKSRKRDDKKEVYVNFIKTLWSLSKGTDNMQELEKYNFEEQLSYMTLVAEAKTVNHIYMYLEFIENNNKQSDIDDKYLKLVNIIRADYHESRKIFKSKNIEKAYFITLNETSETERE